MEVLFLNQISIKQDLILIRAAIYKIQIINLMIQQESLKN
jgi:hypothetical protein